LFVRGFCVRHVKRAQTDLRRRAEGSQCLVGGFGPDGGTPAGTGKRIAGVFGEGNSPERDLTLSNPSRLPIGVV
jgi:hypothetical protein